MNKMTLWRCAAGPTLFAFTLTVAAPALAEDKAEAPATAAPAAPQVTVKVRSTGDNVTVAQVTDRMVAAAGNVVVTGMAWKDLCISPCTFKLDPGLHELMVYGDGVTSASKKFDLKTGEQGIVVKPGSSALSTGGVWLTAFGIVSVVTGVLFLVTFTKTTKFRCDLDNSCPEEQVESSTHKLALPFLIGGAAGTGLGIFMISAGSTSIEPEGSATAVQRPNPLARNSLGVNYHGTW